MREVTQDGVVGLPFDTNLRIQALNDVVTNHKLVLFAGFSGSGMREVFDNYEFRSNTFTCSKWDRAKIFDMIVKDKTYDKLNNPISKLEEALFSEIFTWEDHKVIVFAPFLTRRSRGHYLQMAKNYKTAILFGDASNELLIENEIEKGVEFMEAKVNLASQRGKFEPPSFTEDLTSIFYISTFTSKQKAPKAIEYYNGLSWKLKG